VLLALLSVGIVLKELGSDVKIIEILQGVEI